MTRPLDTPPPGLEKKRYPLDDWFDGRVWLIEDDDHGCYTFNVFISGLYSQAKARGLRLHGKQHSERTGLIWAERV